LAELSTQAPLTRTKHSTGRSGRGSRHQRKGEAQQATAAGLDLLRVLGWLVLHDVTLPGEADAAVDHVLAGPSGVYVVNTVSWSGAINAQEHLLTVGGTDRTDALAEVAAAADAVRGLLDGIPVAPLLCFERLEAVAGFVSDVALCASENILDLLTSQPQILDARAIGRTSRALTSGFATDEPEANGTPPVAKAPPTAAAVVPPPVALVVEPVVEPVVEEPTAPVVTTAEDAARVETFGRLMGMTEAAPVTEVPEQPRRRRGLLRGSRRTSPAAVQVEVPAEVPAQIPAEAVVEAPETPAHGGLAQSSRAAIGDAGAALWQELVAPVPVVPSVEPSIAPSIEPVDVEAALAEAEARQREVEEVEAREQEARERASQERADQEAKERAERAALEAAEAAEREAEERVAQEARDRKAREARERVEREALRLAELEAREQAEREAREKAEAEARAKAEAEAKAKAEAEAKAKAEAEAKAKAEAEARAQAAREQAEREAREKAEAEARAKAEAEAKAKAEAEARAQAEAEAREQAAREQAEREAREKAEAEARAKAEAEARAKAEAEARAKAEAEARAKAEAEAKAKAEAEARAKAEAEARAKAEAEAKAKAEAEAREQAAREQAEREAREKAEAEARAKAEAEAKAKAEAEVRAQAAREQAEREAREKAEAEAREKAEAEAEEAQQRAAWQARLHAARERDEQDERDHVAAVAAEAAADAAAAAARREAEDCAAAEAEEAREILEAQLAMEQELRAQEVREQAAQEQAAQEQAAQEQAAQEQAARVAERAITVEERPVVRQVAMPPGKVDAGPDAESSPRRRQGVPMRAFAHVALGALLIAAVIVGAPRVSGVVDWGQQLFAKSPPTTVGTAVDLEATTLHPALQVLAGTPVDAKLVAGTRPPKGQHLVAVPFRLGNTGTGPWDAPIGAAAKVIDSLGVSHDVLRGVKAVKGMPLLAAQVRVAPGQVVKGYAVFAVPNGRTLSSVTLGLARTGTDPVTWQVGP
jgi:hypothetical protein